MTSNSILVCVLSLVHIRVLYRVGSRSLYSAQSVSRNEWQNEKWVTKNSRILHRVLYYYTVWSCIGYKVQYNIEYEYMTILDVYEIRVLIGRREMSDKMRNEWQKKECLYSDTSY